MLPLTTAEWPEFIELAPGLSFSNYYIWMVTSRCTDESYAANTESVKQELTVQYNVCNTATDGRLSNAAI